MSESLDDQYLADVLQEELDESRLAFDRMLVTQRTNHAFRHSTSSPSQIDRLIADEWRDEFLGDPESYPAELHQHMALFIAQHSWFSGFVDEDFDRLSLPYTNEFAERLLSEGGEYLFVCIVDRFTDFQPDAELARALILKNPDLAVYVLDERAAYGYEPDDTILGYLLDENPGVALDRFDAFNMPRDRATFNRLLEQAPADELVFYLDIHFPDLERTPEMAYSLAEHGAGRQLLSKCQSFGIRPDDELAKAFIRGGSSRVVVDCLPRFEGLTPAIIPELTRSGVFDTPTDVHIAQWPKYIDGLQLDAQFADLLLETKGSARALSMYQRHFTGLTRQHAYGLAEHGEFGFLSYAESFEGFAFDNEFAKFVLDLGCPDYLMNSLSDFRDLDAECFEQLVGLINKTSDASAYIGTTASRQLAVLWENLFRFRDVDPDLQREVFETMSYFEPFPGGGSMEGGWTREQNRWFGRNRKCEKMTGGWSDEKIGQLIGLRLRLGLESTIHDASYWLDTFQYPNDGVTFDIDMIKQKRLDTDFDKNNLPGCKVEDYLKEVTFLRHAIGLSQTEREQIKLSAKPGVEKLLFNDVVHRVVYRALVSDCDGTPLYKLPGTAEQRRYAMQAKAELVLEDIAQNDPNYAHSMHNAKYVQLVRDELREFFKVIPEGKPNEPISAQLGVLKQMGLARKRYIDDATTWLMKHATSPRRRLTRVWSDRSLALAEGVVVDEAGNRVATVEDTASSIEQWQTERALRSAVDNIGSSHKTTLNQLGMAPEDLMGGNFTDARRELTRALGANDTLEAMIKLAKWRASRRWQEKILPAADVEVETSTSAAPWKVEILDKDDPRGFTIGEDTGCCMTLHGQAESCLKAGYKKQNAGFLAVYNDEGALAAQSFWYVHPEHPDVLVIDNIEANKGRDKQMILGVYEMGISKILERAQNEQLPASAIRRVHIGEGCSDVNLNHLPVVQPVPKLKKIYTDANEQRLLLGLE